MLDAAATIILLVLVALRPLIGESYDTAQNSISAGLTELAPPMPARTVVIDLLILGTSAGVLARRWKAREYRSTGLEGGLVILLVASVMSCLAAGQKRVAINATLDWLCMPVLAVALAQVMTRACHRRLLLAVIVASASANAVECLEQAYISLPETRRDYEQHREAFWRERGVPLDSDMVRMFEARLAAGEAHGFMFHGNVTGGYLVMVVLTVIGVVLSGVKRDSRPSNIAKSGTAGAGAPSPGIAWRLSGAMLIALMAWAIILTGSLGAMIGGAAGVGAWALAWSARRWIAIHPHRAIGIGCGAAVAAGAVVLGHGLYHGTLPGASLNFRWQYWQTSLPLIRDHVWTGVGRENFVRHYLQYKSIFSPEEVASPHNLFVQAAADWGIFGPIGLGAMIVGAMFALAQAYAHRKQGIHDVEGRTESVGRCPSEAVTSSDSHENDQGETLWTWATAGLIFVVVFAVRCPLLGSDNDSYIVWVTAMTGMVWSATCALVLFLSRHITDWRRIAAGGAAGLAAFLVQDTINFALFVPASATTCFALYALVLSSFRAESRGAASSRAMPCNRVSRGATLSIVDRIAWEFCNRKPAVIPLGVVIMLLVAATWQAWIVVRGNRKLGEARRLMQTTHLVVPTDGVAMIFGQAAGMDTLDPTPWVEAGDWQLRNSYAAATDWPGRLTAAVDAYKEALKRDPKSTDIRRRLARTCLEASRAAGEDGRAPSGEVGVWASRAVAWAEEITRLYPADPSAWRLLGECLSQAAGTSRDGRNDRLRAAEALTRALELDASRPQWEVIRRFSPDTRRQIEERIAELTADG